MAPIIEWEISKEEWRNRYRQYLPKGTPVIIAADATGLILLWLKDALLPGATILAFFHLGILWWLIREYRSLPHRYQLLDDGILFTVGNRTTHYQWSDFAGYMIGQEVATQSNALRRTQRVQVSPTDIGSAMQSSREIFGAHYQLVRPWRWTTVWPLTGSIMITAEPEVEEQVQRVITARLKKIPLQKFEDKMGNVGAAIGLVLGIALIAYAVLSVYVL